jgi:alpha-galactosidase
MGIALITTPMRSVVILFWLAVSLTLSSQKFENLALTPPMGWNSWNHYTYDGISERVVMETADAMVSSGMRDAGYEYIVIDDCWQVDRDNYGNIIADPVRFPSGMKALADYVHARGLKFGLYSCAGIMTCQRRPGSRGYEYQDARTYAAWGVDFLKYDWCNTGTQDAVASYTLMRDALYAQGRPVVFSICEWGLSKPWLWAQDVGHMYRTTGDIRNNWDIPDAKEGKVWGGGIIVILDMQQELDRYAGPGHWNDPDMLFVGNGVLTPAESQSHFSLWAMLAAPLMAGNNLMEMDPETLEVLTNWEVIAIDQDSLGICARKVIDEGEFEVFEKRLAGEEISYCFFNRHDHPYPMAFDWSRLDLDREYRIRDLWGHAYIGTTGTITKKEIPVHGVLHVRLMLAE